MRQIRTLKILAWIFTAAAILAMIYSSVTGKGAFFWAMLMVFALVCQNLYARANKRGS